MREPFGVRLRKVRMEKGFSIRKLAKKIGIEFCRISDYEKGKHIPNVTTLEWICDALGVTATELLGY